MILNPTAGGLCGTGVASTTAMGQVSLFLTHPPNQRHHRNQIHPTPKLPTPKCHSKHIIYRPGAAIYSRWRNFHSGVSLQNVSGYSGIFQNIFRIFQSLKNDLENLLGALPVFRSPSTKKCSILRRRKLPMQNFIETRSRKP